MSNKDKVKKIFPHARCIRESYTSFGHSCVYRVYTKALPSICLATEYTARSAWNRALWNVENFPHQYGIP